MIETTTAQLETVTAPVAKHQQQRLDSGARKLFSDPLFLCMLELLDI
jgi:hypothetical protein